MSRKTGGGCLEGTGWFGCGSRAELLGGVSRRCGLVLAVPGRGSSFLCFSCCLLDGPALGVGRRGERRGGGWEDGGGDMDVMGSGVCGGDNPL